MASALAAGIRFFQYRNKSGTRRDIYETSLRLALMASESGALFIVNDHADIAAAVGADGVHLGQDDLPIASARIVLGGDKLIGISTHSVEQARAALAAGADYIGFGPVFRTATKNAGEAQGCARIVDIKRAVPIPVIAIGGITHENVQDVMRAGADGVAVISAILSEPDIQRAAEELLSVMKSSEVETRGN